MRVSHNIYNIQALINVKPASVISPTLLPAAQRGTSRNSLTLCCCCIFSLSFPLSFSIQTADFHDYPLIWTVSVSLSLQAKGVKHKTFSYTLNTHTHTYPLTVFHTSTPHPKRIVRCEKKKYKLPGTAHSQKLNKTVFLASFWLVITIFFLEKLLRTGSLDVWFCLSPCETRSPGFYSRRSHIGDTGLEFTYKSP